MRYRVFVLAASIGLGVASCGENTPPATPGGDAAGTVSTAPRPMLPAPPGGPVTPATGTQTQVVPTATGSNGLPRSAAPTVADDPIPPADAQWTLFCYSVGEFDHVQRANQIKAALRQKTGRNDWYVIHGSNESHLYFGFYRTINNPQSAQDQKEVGRARADREMVATIRDDHQKTPFNACTFVPLSAPDPASKPEWNLANVDLDKDPKDATRAFWSLQIMAFRDDPRRKEAAVQAVEALRQNGVPAYFYHGESVSSVCVGAWPPGAVKEHVVDPMMPDVAVADPNALMIVTSQPLAPTLVPRPQRGAEKVEAVSPKLDVLDKSMAATIKQFPTHAVNYEVRVHKGIRKGPDGKEEPVKVPDSSFLVMIPRPKGNGLYDSDAVLPPPIASERGMPYGANALNGAYGSQEAPSAFVNPGGSRRAASAYDPSGVGDATGAGVQWGPAPGGSTAGRAGSPAARQFGTGGGSTAGGTTGGNAGTTAQQPPSPQPATPGAGRLRRLGDR